jgi:hypothetical protein
MKSKTRVTVNLDRQILAKAKALAARRSTTISGLLADLIQTLVADDDAYLVAERRARALMDQGFDMGARPRVTRDELHER